MEARLQLDAVNIGMPVSDWKALPVAVRQRMTTLHNDAIRAARSTR